MGEAKPNPARTISAKPTAFRPEPHNDENQYVAVEQNGKPVLLYDPWPHQLKFHESQTPNLLAFGTRGTGKSSMLRWDAIMRCLMIPHFRAIILRRTMPQLRESHLNDIGREMELLGGDYLAGTFIAKFPNGSSISFRHCETIADVESFLSSQYGAIYFDEISTFTLEMFLKISAAARAPEGAGYSAVVRAGSNPLGIGAEWMKRWFIDKDVDYSEYDSYNPDDYEMQFSTLEDNPSMNRKDYEKRLRNLPEHVRRAWLLGEFVIEGAYFGNFRKRASDMTPWHVLDEQPLYEGRPLWQYPWISVYRAVDWGYSPDPAVCLWIAYLPNKKAYVIKEKMWKETLAEDVARDIVRLSEGMNIVETYADPTMGIKTGAAAFSVAEQFEMNGVPLTLAVNDRTKYGYSVQEFLNRLIDGTPQLQIVEYAAPNLVRTFPMMRMHDTDPTKLADGEDHFVVALAYFCMSQPAPALNPAQPVQKFWMTPKKQRRMHG